MGSSSSMPSWSKIKKKTENINANLTTLTGTTKFLGVFLIVILKKLAAKNKSKFGT